MGEQYELCELHRLRDLDRLSVLVDALEARGIESDVWDKSGGLSQALHPGSSVMVQCSDLVYARWIAYSVGVDTWLDAPAEEAG
jgi:hypothetical protein